jgi:hypothetical protein
MRRVQRLPTYRLGPWVATWFARGLSIVGFVVLAESLLAFGIAGAGGSSGIDAIAYWTAASNVRDGLPLYALPEGAFRAYAYPPVLAQLLVPFSFLPMPAFVWLWRALELGALRLTVGSWTRTGLALLLPPVIAEIHAGNVHLLMAAVCALAMRGVASTVAPATLLKFASVPLLPLAWQGDRRGLIAGGVAAGAGAIVSIAVAPSAWEDFVRFLRTTSFPSGWYNLAEDVPVVLRLGIAATLGVAATRWVRLAPVAVLLAYPVVWYHALSTLVAMGAPIGRPRGGSTAVVGEPAAGWSAAA